MLLLPVLTGSAALAADGEAHQAKTVKVTII
jgi:hypothetical protein